MEYKELFNGVHIPMFGIGTFQISPADTERAVYTALRDGYRLIDTANAYLNEAAVGRAMARAITEGVVRREEIFLSTKIWPTLYTSETAVDEALERLGTDYIDLLFIHQPAGDFVAGYRAIEAAYRCGKARSLGISNFHGEKLERLLAATEVKPHVIQLETHPGCIQHTVLERLAPYGTAVMGWYPLGHGDPSLLGAPVFTWLSDKYRKSTVQIVLRWAVQMGFITIPGTKNPEHIRANFDLFDFALTAEEMAEIARFDGTRRYYTPDTATEERYAAMPLSFEE